MAIGILGAVLTGLTTPVNSLIFGNLVDVIQIVHPIYLDLKNINIFRQWCHVIQ